MPQAYLELANDALSVKLGHFYHPLGAEFYDVAGAQIGNTPTYSLFYSEFLPITGGMVDWNVSDQLVLSGGLHRGNGNWEDNNNVMNGFGKFHWVNAERDTMLMYVFDVGAEDNAGNNNQYIHSIVFEKKFCDGWAYILHSDYGFINNGATAGGDATWYSVINVLGYQFNEKLNAGVRYEWFDDKDGVRVAPAPGSGVWNGLAVGGTYKFTPQVWLRPELRWDWFDADNGVGPGPFKNGTERSQFLASMGLFVFF